MQTILIVNSKGGCGKTTIATTLASYFVNQGEKTALMDYDPQGSSLYWLKTRPPKSNLIYAADAAPAKGGKIRSWQMNIPNDIEKLVIDAPAGADGLVLQEMVARADFIVIPVAPSTIDVHASADFVKRLMLVGKVDPKKTRIAVIANRVYNKIPLYEPLRRFLNALNIPFVTKLTDSGQYVSAAEQGLSIFDLSSKDAGQEQSEFILLIKWLGNPFNKKRPAYKHVNAASKESEERIHSPA